VFNIIYNFFVFNLFLLNYFSFFGICLSFTVIYWSLPFVYYIYVVIDLSAIVLYNLFIIFYFQHYLYFVYLSICRLRFLVIIYYNYLFLYL